MTEKINTCEYVMLESNVANMSKLYKITSFVPEVVVDRPRHGFRNTIDLHQIFDSGARNRFCRSKMM
ncbi:Uncharacterised protein [Brucella melitensis]|nr:Uncharacterised protein [Brucella melitensis]